MGEETLYSRRGCRAPEVLAGHHTQVGKLLCSHQASASHSLSLLLFPEPTVVQVLFKDSSVVLLLLLTLTTLFSP